MRYSRLAAIPMVAFALAIGACTAEVEEEGSLPDVDVQGGEMPQVDVDPVDVNVDVNADTNMVVTPDIDVSTTPQ